MVIVEQVELSRWLAHFVLAESDAGATSVVGSINRWGSVTHPFPYPGEGGLRVVTIEVDAGTVLEFRYLSEPLGWLDESEAPDFRQSDFGIWNAVVVVPMQVLDTTTESQ